MNFVSSRLLMLSLIALAATVSDARGLQIDVSLNLFLNDPNDSSRGGDWQLVAKTDAAHGIAALVVDLNDVDNGPSEIVFADDIGAMTSIFGQPPWTSLGAHTELFYGQELTNPSSVVVGVGTSITSDGPDPLGTPAWDDATQIVSGTFGLVLPSFSNTDIQGNPAQPIGNVLTAASPPFIGTDANVTTVVRISAMLGDLNKDGTVDANDIDTLTAGLRGGTPPSYFDLDGSLSIDNGDVSYLVETILGTHFGDADLNGSVTASSDGAVLLANLGGTQGDKGWADADFDGDQNVTASGDGATILANLGSDSAAVPEPSCGLFLVVAMAMVSPLLWRRASR